MLSYMVKNVLVNTATNAYFTLQKHAHVIYRQIVKIENFLLPVENA